MTEFNRSSPDWFVDVQRGVKTGYSMVHKYGRNPALPNGSFETIGLLSTTRSFLQSAVSVRVAAGNVADDTAGAGAREITIQGIDSTLAEATASVATAGASASANFSGTWWRVFRTWVSSAGTYDSANTAAVIVEQSAGGNLIQIDTEHGQSEHAFYTIPTGFTGYLMSVDINVDGGRAADVTMLTRENFNDVSAPLSAVRIKRYFAGVLGNLRYSPRAPSNKLEALTDIWFEGSGNGGVTAVSIDFEILLEAD